MAQARLRSMMFAPELAAALSDGRKTQTRRPMARQPDRWQSTPDGICVSLDGSKLICPHGLAGDAILVREKWGYRNQFLDRTARAEGPLVYAADGPPRGWHRLAWRSSLHMPRSVARLTLRITSAQAQRLCDISADDARAEGYPADRLDDPVSWFASLWDGIYGPRQLGWKDNPWVWALTFKVERSDAAGTEAPHVHAAPRPGDGTPALRDAGESAGELSRGGRRASGKEAPHVHAGLCFGDGTAAVRDAGEGAGDLSRGGHRVPGKEAPHVHAGLRPGDGTAAVRDAGEGAGDLSRGGRRASGKEAPHVHAGLRLEDGARRGVLTTEGGADIHAVEDDSKRHPIASRDADDATRFTPTQARARRSTGVVDDAAVPSPTQARALRDEVCRRLNETVATLQDGGDRNS